MACRESSNRPNCAKRAPRNLHLLATQDRGPKKRWVPRPCARLGLSVTHLPYACAMALAATRTEGRAKRNLIVFDGDDTLWSTEQLYDRARSAAARLVASVGLDPVRFETLQ